MIRKKRKDFYISGPMRGIKELNKPLFFLVERLLNEKGFTTWNPAAHDDYINLTFRDCIVSDIKAIIDECKKIVFITGWRSSLGANIEAFVAMAANREAAEIKISDDSNDFDLIPIDLSKYILPYGSGDRKSFDPHSCDISYSPD